MAEEQSHSNNLATQLATQLAVITNDMAYMKNDIHDIKQNVQQGYVTKEEFEPIKKIVYGLVGLILIAVVGAILSLVVTR